jgi:hypothetical protein
VVRFEVEIPVSVNGFSVDLCDQCCLFFDDQNILFTKYILVWDFSCGFNLFYTAVIVILLVN